MIAQTLFRALSFVAIVLASTTFATPIPASGSTAALVTQERAFKGGYNNFGCKPSLEHPHPIILVHGLLANSAVWSYMGPRFALEGYCVFSLNYGLLPGVPLLGGLNDLMSSAQELSDFVDQVLAATGASKVDIVGHSEGSVLPRVYLKYFNSSAKTGSFATIGSNQYGTSWANLVTILSNANLMRPVQGVLSPVCKACFQLTTGCPFLRQLNEGGDTYPEVKYLMLVSRYDEVITPYTNGFLKTKRPNVHNVELQNLCALDISEHFIQLIDPIAFNAIEHFLRTGTVTKTGCAALLQ